MKRILGWIATITGMIVAAFIGATIAARSRFDRQVEQEVSELLTGHTLEEEIVTDAMLEGLPEPVRRYLSYTGIVGKPMAKTVHLRQRGSMRLSRELPGIPLNAEQFYSVLPPGFVWDGKVGFGPLTLVRGRDKYVNGNGNMLIKIGSLIPVVDATGAEMDQGAMMRYLSEMIWFPSAFLAPNISFEAIDDHAANVTLTDRGRSVSATMYFDDQGRVTNLVAQRYRGANSGFVMSTWETPITAYGEFEGLKLPVRGKAVWKLPEGDFDYIDVEITDIIYNKSAQLIGHDRSHAAHVAG